MYAYDARARALAEGAIAGGLDRALTTVQRLFLALTFMHSEWLADQERCAALVAANVQSRPDLQGWLLAAEAHRDVIMRFGRFPHRNSVLGRDSTEAELTYLAAPDAGW